MYSIFVIYMNVFVYLLNYVIYGPIFLGMGVLAEHCGLIPNQGAG